MDWQKHAEQAHRRKIFQSRAGFSLRLFLGVFFVSPLVIALLFSFVPNELLDQVPNLRLYLQSLTFENYEWVFKNVPIFRFIFNSLVICVIVITVQVIVSSLSAYAFSFFNFPGKAFFFNLILVVMMIPGQVVTIANFLLIQDMGLLNSYLGLVLPYLISGSSVFLMRQYYLQLPKELKEASEIDGCSDMRFLFVIAMPLAVPTIAALAIRLFIDCFNWYFWPLLVGQKETMYTLQIGMRMLVAEDATQYGRILAGAVISIVIPAITYIIGQDYIIKGMTAGSVKG